MKAGKTYDLRVRPISKIKEEEMEFEVLATNGYGWISGNVGIDRYGDYYCDSEDFGIMFNITHFAVLPKDE